MSRATAGSTYPHISFYLEFFYNLTKFPDETNVLSFPAAFESLTHMFPSADGGYRMEEAKVSLTTG